MPNWVVLKFGGTSVSTRERWETIAKQAQQKLDAGQRPVIVCSAVSGISNALEKLLTQAVDGEHEATLAQILDRHRELATELEIDADDVLGDFFENLERMALGASLTREVSARLHARVMALGELMSTRMGAAFLATQGVEAAWQDARDALQAEPEVGANEQRHYLSATCGFAPDEDLQSRWDALDSVILTQGFIAHDDDGDTVLLGRGGSDTSAAYFAAKLQADLLEVWTDVPGMYTANPHAVPSARLLKHLGYDEAQEIATMGGKVLHPRCIDPVRRYDIPLQIRCTQAPEVEGTRISSNTPDFGAQVKAISAKTGVMLVSMDTLGMWQQVGFLADAFAAFKRNGLSVDLVATSETNVTVSLDPGANALDESTMKALLRDLRPFCDAKQIGSAAAVSLIGQNIRTILHQLGPALEAFEEQQIYMVSQAASDLNITFVVDEEQAQKLVNKLHRMLFHERVSDALLGPTWKEVFEDEKRAPAVAPKGAWWAQKRDELLEIAASESAAYVYDTETLEDRANQVLSMGADRVFYAIKANSNPGILRRFEKLGLGFECVSPGELDRVVETMPKLDRDRILFTPNFADEPEYAKAFELGTHVTLDNLFPLEHWGETFRGQSVLVRMDPGRGKGHHKYVKTAGPRSKFGVAPAEVERLKELVAKYDVNVRGLHVHVGSGIRSAATWAENATFLARTARDLDGVQVLNLGGGLGVPEKPGQKPLDPASVAEALSTFRATDPGFEIWMEPGRFLVAESGVLLARVTQTKSKGEVKYVGVATGMNTLIRPALYGAYHQIVNLTRLDQRTTMVADVVGPICETGDVLGHRRRLPKTFGGDIMLIATTGAYGRAMSSEYNLREPAVEIMLD